MFSRSRRWGSDSTMLQNSHLMEFGAMRDIDPANQAGRQHALGEPPEDAPHADVHFADAQFLVLVDLAGPRRSRR